MHGPWTVGGSDGGKTTVVLQRSKKETPPTIVHNEGQQAKIAVIFGQRTWHQRMTPESTPSRDHRKTHMFGTKIYNREVGRYVGVVLRIPLDQPTMRETRYNVTHRKTLSWRKA